MVNRGLRTEREGRHSNMPGTRGQITRATGGSQRTIYLSDVFGVWEEADGLHITLQRGDQDAHIRVTPQDGTLYDVLRMLHQYGLSLP